MGPITLHWYVRSDKDGKALIEQSQHFELNESLVFGAREIFTKTDGYYFAGELPAESVVFEGGCLSCILRRTKNGRIEVYHSTDTLPLEYMGSYFAGDPSAVVSKNFRNEKTLGESQVSKTDLLHSMMFLDLICTLIATPRLVQVSPIHRQRKRAFQRANGTPAIAWHRVSWTIGDSVRARAGETKDNNWRAPLHFCRAHWRHAKASDPHSVRRGDGWYTWIKHSFKGHPDFGIRLHHYQPNIEPDGKSAATIAATKAMISGWQQQHGYT